MGIWPTFQSLLCDSMRQHTQVSSRDMLYHTWAPNLLPCLSSSLQEGCHGGWLPTFPVQSKVVSSSFVLWNIRFSYCSPPHQIGTVGENGILYRVFRALSFKSLGESTFVWKIASYHSIKYVSWRTCIQNQSWGHQHRKRGQISLGIPDPELTKCSVSFWSGTLNIHREI